MEVDPHIGALTLIMLRRKVLNVDKHDKEETQRQVVTSWDARSNPHDAATLSSQQH